jgi:alkylation response protein AidB-like acyl-CoA dehydrogenase
MNFDFDDTQYALRDLARDLFAKESPPSRVRGLWEGKPFDRGVWKTMAEAGICGITVPDDLGGAGGTVLDLVLVLEEAGRACLPEPVLETTAIAAPSIAAFGTEEQRERWLPSIASGETIAAIDADATGHVAWAAEADLLVASRDDGVHLLGRDDFTATPVAGVDGARPLAKVETRTSSRTRMNDDASNVRLYVHAFTGIACVLNGIAQRLVQMTVDHVKEREQFGRPVGSFQAVKHKLASMHVAVESARPAAWYAAYAIANGLDGASIEACVAKIAANDAEAFCNSEALQCHGGIGFTWEHDLHFWLKRGMALRGSFGTSPELRRNLTAVHDWDELL